MDKFEQIEMKQISNLLISYIPHPLRKSAGSFKDKISSLSKQIHINKWCMGEKPN